MKTAIRKPDSESRNLAKRIDSVQQKTGNGLQINDNRSASLAQMKFIESLQAKEETQQQSPLEEEELPKG